MKTILNFMLVIVFFTSCSKESSEEQNNDLFQVSFNTSFIDYDISDLKSSSESLTAIDYVLFDESGNFIKSEKFGINDEISDMLPVGNYSIGVVIHGIASSSFTGGPGIDQYYWLSNDRLISSIFFNKKQFSINADQTNEISLDVKRVTGRLVLNIQDLPSNVAWVKLEWDEYYPTGFKLSDLRGGYYPNNSITADVNNLTFNFIVDSFDSDALHDISISCFDSADELLAVKTLNAVPVERNRVTTVSGNMFGDSSTSSNKVSYNSEEWGESIDFNF
jgi:hypothetical protein